MQQLLFFVNSIALGVGLAMDAFSVSIANGLREPEMNKKRMLSIAGTYAVFQVFMPLIGWFLVRTAADTFTQIQPFIPWTALALLLFIGGRMVVEGIKESKGPDEPDSERESGSVAPAVGFKELMGQGVATSIDALSVGFTIAEYRAPSAVGASAIIGGVTLAICMAGLRLGKAFGKRAARRGTLLGGAILIIIGLEIFIRGVVL